MPSFNLQDLTGKVRKTEKYYFANGGLADIWKGEWSGKKTPRIVAIKVIRTIWSKADHLEHLKMKIMREAKLWSQLDHPNITPLYGICFDLGAGSAPCLVAPYFSNGNVAKYVKENQEVDRMRLVSQVASGLAYLHGHKIIHGDMKASNVLVNDEGEACLSDFGLSRILEKSGFTTKIVGGTCRWMAYELIAPPEDDEDESMPQLTKASDVWAFSMTVLEILTGQLPFSHLKYDTAVILSVMRGGRPQRQPGIKDSVWSILQQCWLPEPTQRPSMESLSLYFDLMSSDTPSLRALPISDTQSMTSHEADALYFQPWASHDMSSQPMSGSQDNDSNRRYVPQSNENTRPPAIPRYFCHWSSCSGGFSTFCEYQIHEALHPDIRFCSRSASFSDC